MQYEILKLLLDLLVSNNFNTEVVHEKAKELDPKVSEYLTKCLPTLKQCTERTKQLDASKFTVAQDAIDYYHACSVRLGTNYSKHAMKIVVEKTYNSSSDPIYMHPVCRKLVEYENKKLMELIDANLGATL